MSMTREELEKLIYDPSLTQKKVLDYLSDFNDGSMVVSDPTNPFVMLLEAAASMASNSIIKCNNEIRKAYPSLANQEDDLYHHITDNELTNMFAVPAEVSIYFYVSVVDLERMGYQTEGTNFKETIIPKNTSIEILGVTLTLLNDISVRLYTNGTSYVEQQLNSENDLAYDTLSSLDSRIVTDSEGVSWIQFETLVKQIKRVTSNKSVTMSDSFKQLIPIEDYYCYSLISYKGTGTNNEYKQLSRAHNDEYIDPQTPTAYISVYDSNVLIRIPDVYTVEGVVNGSVNMEIYTTKGEIYLPINKYQHSDYKITLGDTSSTQTHATISNISVVCASFSVLNGGLNGMSTTELKESIINNTTGDIDLPITDKQLERYTELNGYQIAKLEDLITGRLYLALKSLPAFSSNLIFSKQDVFFNTCKCVVDDISDYPNVIVDTDIFIIKSNTIFKENNGVVTILSPDEQTALTSLENIKLIDHLSSNKYFYNPYYYLIEINDELSEARVYDLDSPVINNTRIIAKNLTVDPRANINKYSITKNEMGYKIMFSVISNDNFKDLDTNSIKIQMKIPLYGGTSYAYINGTYNQDYDAYEFQINTTLNINNEDQIDITNGYSDLSTRRFNIDTDVYIYFMSSDPGVLDPSLYLQDEVYISDNKRYTVFTKESINITFGIKLEYIYNRLYNVYSERKYKKYQDDVPKVYAEDVYEIQSDGYIFTCVPDDAGGHRLEYTILHNKGDAVLDENDQPIYEHKKDELMLDENGEPIIDTLGGIVRYIDILLLEYEFYVSNSNAYTNYKQSVLDNLRKFITEDMVTLNNKLLDNTKIKYKSFKTSKNINVITNNVQTTIPYLISPDITLYLSSVSTLSIDEQENYKNAIGEVINNHCDKNVIKLEDIKSDIKTKLGTTVAGVKILNLDSDNSEIITIKDANTKLTLAKTLSLNKNNEYIVKYNINLEIVYL